MKRAHPHVWGAAALLKRSRSTSTAYCYVQYRQDVAGHTDRMTNTGTIQPQPQRARANAAAQVRVPRISAAVYPVQTRAVVAKAAWLRRDLLGRALRGFLRRGEDVVQVLHAHWPQLALEDVCGERWDATIGVGACGANAMQGGHVHTRCERRHNGRTRHSHRP